MIDAYEAAYDEPAVGFWTEIGQTFGFRRDKKLPEI
jgi:amino acid transporter